MITDTVTQKVTSSYNFCAPFCLDLATAARPPFALPSSQLAARGVGSVLELLLAKTPSPELTAVSDTAR